MIKYSHIKGFRCFPDTRIEGYGSVNLFGGQNNVGKTSILEALLLTVYPLVQTLNIIRKSRGIHDLMIKSAPSKFWSEFFWNFPHDKTAVIDLGEIGELTLSYLNGNLLPVLANYFPNEEGVKIREWLAGNISHSSGVRFSANVLHGAPTELDFLAIADKDGGLLSAGQIFDAPEHLPFLSARGALEALPMSALYSSVRNSGKKNEVLNALRMLDETFEDIEIDAPGGIPFLQIQLKNGRMQKLNLFGDGIRRMTEIMLTILSSGSSYIFIDEIENGLHYSKQKEIWRNLFRVSTELKVQIFATSHSLEMIKAFNEISLEQSGEKNGMYFEMSRGRISGNTVVNAMSPEMLQYEIGNGLTFRGE